MLTTVQVEALIVWAVNNKHLHKPQDKSWSDMETDFYVSFALRKLVDAIPED